MLLPLVALAFAGCGDDDPAAPPAPAPRVNKVLQLDGIDSYVSIPIANHNFVSFTIECWIKVPAYDLNVHYVSLYQNAYLVLGDYGSPNAHVDTWADGLNPVNARTGNLAAITADAWHHLAFTFDGTTQTILTDGVVTLSVPTTGTVTNDVGSYNSGLNIGCRYSGSSQFVNGQIDDVRLWNVYRTPAEIQANMSKVLTAQSGMVGYWNFDDGTADDLTAYGADGALTGSATIVNK
ncbi:MAG: LamG domain-containing protein [Candidatus Krumholzibacteria bacterium]|nr:LamG domain-containing protein [Candidatus Krumholzibacteria bacterium]